MKLKIEIDLDNQAFENNDSADIVTILNYITGKLQDNYCQMNLYLKDINGNHVGDCTIE